MNNKMKTILIILTIFIAACGTTSKVNTINPIAEENKDVLILSNLIREHLIRTNEIELNLIELLKNDTLNRITNSFEKVELKYHGGYISVYYNHSKTRNDKIELTDSERIMLTWKKVVTKNLDGLFDGEIQFEYGERFYRIKKVIIKSKYKP
jgi:hypothetical protein